MGMGDLGPMRQMLEDGLPMLTPHERDVLEYGDFVASWRGGDGKKYCTHDPEVVRRRVRAGHTGWVVSPPTELLTAE